MGTRSFQSSEIIWVTGDRFANLEPVADKLFGMALAGKYMASWVVFRQGRILVSHFRLYINHNGQI
jgi:hypothetical protein